MSATIVILIISGIALFAAIWALRQRKQQASKLLSQQVPTEKRGGLLRQLGVRFNLQKKDLDSEEIQQLRHLLLAADFGTKASDELLQTLLAQKTSATIEEQLKAAIFTHLKNYEKSFLNLPQPSVVLVVGINGSGKTTSIAKLAAAWQALGHKIVLGAGDTFRAAAAEQLATWAQRLGLRIVKQNAGADPAAVAFDTVMAAKKDNATALIDTAGRIHIDQGLMAELKKVYQVVDKARQEKPLESWLVLDANQGQIAVEQAKKFVEVTKCTGIIISKLDSGSKGGFLVRVVSELNIPIVACGTGENITDLQPFSAQWFTERLFAAEENG